MEYEWGTDPGRVLGGATSTVGSDANGTDYDVVVCADCVYAGASIEPLLASLCQVI